MDFRELENRTAQLRFGQPTQEQENALPWMLASSLMGAGLVIIGKLLPNDWGAWLVLLGVLLEVGATLVIAMRSAWRERTSFRTAKADFAAELQRDYSDYGQLLQWVLQHPREDLENRLRFLRMRLSAMETRLALMSGSIERLGILPVLAALYLQVRDWNISMTQISWTEVSWPSTLLAFFILAIYAASLLAVRLKLRLGLYEKILQDALALPQEA